jgi:hypothetical protein
MLFISPDYTTSSSPRNAFQPVQKLIGRYGDKGLAVIAIHERLDVDWAGKVTEEDLLAFIEKNNIEFPFGIDADTSILADIVPKKKRVGTGAMNSLYDVKATPAIYLIDKRGNVRISPRQDDLEKWVKQLLAE